MSDGVQSVLTAFWLDADGKKDVYIRNFPSPTGAQDAATDALAAGYFLCEAVTGVVFIPTHRVTVITAQRLEGNDPV